MSIAGRTLLEWLHRAVLRVREGPATDAQLREFETRDLGEDVRAAGTMRVIHPRRTRAQ